jgi:hypothetical protein
MFTNLLACLKLNPKHKLANALLGRYESSNSTSEFGAMPITALNGRPDNRVLWSDRSRDFNLKMCGHTDRIPVELISPLSLKLGGPWKRMKSPVFHEEYPQIRLGSIHQPSRESNSQL